MLAKTVTYNSQNYAGTLGLCLAMTYNSRKASHDVIITATNILHEMNYQNLQHFIRSPQALIHR